MGVAAYKVAPVVIVAAEIAEVAASRTVVGTGMHRGMGRCRIRTHTHTRIRSRMVFGA